MLFNSFLFWIFFLIVLAFFHLLVPKSQNRMLLVASCVFYGAWDVRFLSLIFLSTVIDYCCAKAIEADSNPAKKRLYLWVSICTNLGILGWFKYFNFFAENFSALFSLVGWHVDTITLRIVLPVGISFYTFQTMSYTIDVYHGRIRAAKDFFDFALFVAFFPQLVAGPIERAENLMPQIQSRRIQKVSNFTEGGMLCLWGLFKKVVVADNAALWVNAVFAPATDVSPFAVTTGVLAFALQIYGDFSGYSDIARGLARILGFHLMVNFEKPYLAENPSDFWRRWHISLSTWLRDYLYIPLGGSHLGHSRTIRNLMIVMFLGGLWHGASWTFVSWGIYHAALLVLHFIYAKILCPKSKVLAFLGQFRFLRVGVTFILVCVGWIFFRSLSMAQALSFIPLFLEGLFSPAWLQIIFFSNRSLFLTAASFGMLFFYYGHRYSHNKEGVRFEGWPAWSKCMFACGMIGAIFLFGVTHANQFIYFQF